MKFNIFYACNGFDEDLLTKLYYSILSTRRFMEKEDIIVSFHPPYEKNVSNIIKRINKLATCEMNKKHIAKPFAIHPKSTNELRFYGEKINVCDVDCSNVMLLDCDTIILKNPSIMFEGDFDFAGLAMDLIYGQWQQKKNLAPISRRVFKLHKSDVHMWAGAYLVFKNNLHHKIKDVWLDYFDNKRDILDFTCTENRKTYDQSALIPAIHMNTSNIKILNKDNLIYNYSSSFNWELPETCVIVHGNDLVDKLELRKELDRLWDELNE